MSTNIMTENLIFSLTVGKLITVHYSLIDLYNIKSSRKDKCEQIYELLPSHQNSLNHEIIIDAMVNQSDDAHKAARLRCKPKRGSHLNEKKFAAKERSNDQETNTPSQVEISHIVENEKHTISEIAMPLRSD